MPRRDDLNTILVLGSGPIKIGQAAEFDFSGSQAVRALRDAGSPGGGWKYLITVWSILMNSWYFIINTKKYSSMY